MLIVSGQLSDMNVTSSLPAISEYSQASLPIVNIAAYKFVALDRLPERRQALQALCRNGQLKGTILLTPEGINLFLAGSREGIDRLVSTLRAEPELSDLEVKESFSADQPFSRLLVKIKNEIIAFGQDGIAPAEKTSRKIVPAELKEWLDAGRDVVLLDVRNDYEIGVGTFENALPVHVDHFRDFPEAIKHLPEELREKPIVMFCTGGIRCEKAGPFMEREGFQDVYQLSGGILKYFEEVGGAHYKGECFVFDKRVALAPNLLETETRQCYACQSPLTTDDQNSPHYEPPHACPHCHQSPEERQLRLLERRQKALKAVTTPLPGSVPYDNPRPLNVPGRYDGFTLLEFLQQYHPHLGDDFWRTACESGKIRQNHQPVPGDRIVRGGEQFAHLTREQTEPDVSVEIRILFEDDALVVVEKPAPLPMHPSGRFHRNSLQWILNQVYAPVKLRPAHRLDANTTGVALFCKSREISQRVQPQFEQQSVEKWYLVQVQGMVPWEQLDCQDSISRTPTELGGRTIDDDGLPSRTLFERVAVLADGTSLLKARPFSGRTNQIRVHLWQLGFPVFGDPLYLPEQELGNQQTLDNGGEMRLRAAALTLEHPLSRERVTFQAPLPDWWNAEPSEE